jgi:DNA invertase Pin-like site-specific DNA recombinase
MGYMVLAGPGMVAPMERRLIKERQREGIEKAKRNGLYKGGKPRLDRIKIAALRDEGRSPTQIAQAMDCSRMQVYRILNGDAAM